MQSERRYRNLSLITCCLKRVRRIQLISYVLVITPFFLLIKAVFLLFLLNFLNELTLVSCRVIIFTHTRNATVSLWD